MCCTGLAGSYGCIISRWVVIHLGRWCASITAGFVCPAWMGSCLPAASMAVGFPIFLPCAGALWALCLAWRCSVGCKYCRTIFPSKAFPSTPQLEGTAGRWCRWERKRQEPGECAGSAEPVICTPFASAFSCSFQWEGDNRCRAEAFQAGIADNPASLIIPQQPESGYDHKVFSPLPGLLSQVPRPHFLLLVSQSCVSAGTNWSWLFRGQGTGQQTSESVV